MLDPIFAVPFYSFPGQIRATELAKKTTGEDFTKKIT
jgi:hypothetical protein